MSKQIWEIENNAIVWRVDKTSTPHFDNVEMSGLYCDYIVYYGVNCDGTLSLSQKCYFPTLRTIPNDTHATHCFHLKPEEHPQICINGEILKEYPKEIRFDGILSVRSVTQNGYEILRKFFPSQSNPAANEIIEIYMPEGREFSLNLPQKYIHSYGRGTKGVYINEILNNGEEKNREEDHYTIQISYISKISNISVVNIPTDELIKRKERIYQLCDNSLVLETGNPTLDLMTRFAKLRAGESIFQTLTGKYHSPGGQAYYAAIWCNDQVEYAGPHFAMSGDKTAIEASVNAYKAYIPFMSDKYYPLPSSIIAEGLDIWEGAGDRGDAAMYLYGCSLFCLYLGNKETASELFPAIKWCAEYCWRKKLPRGVIGSDSDEFEGRFPTDKRANLSTSCLCYGGLILASRLANSLGDSATADCYASRAEKLAVSIEEYFGANIHGFNTYRYSKGFDTLRAWICLPLCMGITNRADDTLKAMFSPYLWTEEGMLTCELSNENKSNTIWDRSTLYGFKCAFLLGADVIKPFLNYCRKRLLCDRVPYAVEAYPEGEKRQLSGESALFARIITEGMLGITPEDLNSFSFIPNLPKGMKFLNLKSIRICDAVFDIFVKKDKWEVRKNNKTVAEGLTNGKRVVIQ